MNKKGVYHILGIAIPTVVVGFLVWFFIIGPVIEQAAVEALESLGDDAVCPEEFSEESYKICFDSQGSVIVDGIIADNIQVRLDGVGNTCHIRAGSYDFEYSGCELNQFKQLTAYNLLIITKKGNIRINGAKLLSQVSEGAGVVKISPKKISWIKQLLYLVRF